ncbi:hypothetical protein NLG97_g7273 [Lecanicillium saksenae]|uniref:Uncharacterized protein n=1 Tax=Lecanicillium saksenae TaxID=468837 RepID=A0ACC1QMA2_9HYPO|nr:hypothetical protein NLG97_g7273 [Lecanicillium saksenae]
MDSETCGYNEAIENIRDAQYPMLKDSIYLDHAGATVPSKALMDAFASELTSVLYGNPHSGSLPSQLSTDQVDDVRLRLLEFFNADSDEYDLVFVANATAGVKLVLDGLRSIQGGFNYAYHQACHTSLVGGREEARHSICVNDEQVQNWIDGRNPFEDDSTTLFSYTAQSHLDGRRYPMSWGRDFKTARTYTLLDAASLGATSRIDMFHPDFAADFVVLSLYKIFGFPDLGVLLVRKSAEHLFDQRKYFGGGTVDMVVVGREQWHARKTAFLHERLEDGTLPFHNIIAAGIALQTHASLFGSMDQVSRHTAYLTRRLHAGLEKLRHGNGRPVCTLYSPSPESQSTGPVVSFNIRSSLGAWVTLGEFEKLAIVNKIHVRTGGVCSPGGIAAALDLQPWEMKKNFSAGFRCGMDNDIMNGKPVGVIRASLGAMSVKADVDGFLDFIREFFVEVDIPQLPNVSVSDLTGKPSLLVKAITVYPIKSCGGFTVPPGMDWAVRPEGLAWDREWCLLHKGSGQALSQKRYPRMTLLRPTLDFEAGVLRITCKDSLQSVTVPLSADPTLLEKDIRQTKTRVCGEEITAQMYKSVELNNFFSDALGIPCVLARFPPGGRGLGSRLNKAKMQKHQQADTVQRLLPGSFPDDVPSPPDSDSEQTKLKVETKILLSNESPILMIHSASVDALNEAIAQHGGPPAMTSAFRANIVLEGVQGNEDWDKRPAYSEDSWRKVRIGNQTFSLLGACRRCQMVCVDQETGERRQEPLATLSKTRRFNGKIYFGAHMKHDEMSGSSEDVQHPTIRIGEPVVVDG